MKLLTLKHWHFIHLIFLTLLILTFSLASSIPNFTVVGQIGQVVLLKDMNSKQVKAHRIGQKVFASNLTIHTLLPDRIILETPEKNRLTIATKLQLSDDTGHRIDLNATGSNYHESGFERKSSANQLNIRATAEFVRNIKTHLPSIIMEASSEVTQLPNGNIAISVFNFSDNSLFAKLGLKKSDDPSAASALTHINGQPIRNAAQAIAMLKQAENKKSISFTILEDGQEKKADINVM